MKGDKVVALREGKRMVQVTLKQEIIDILDEIAKKEITSRSAIAGKIIEDYISKYLQK